MIGTTLSHYAIEAELGRGGMGIVYRARDTKLDRTVAIKVLPASALSNEDDRARFYREAKAAASLNHPNIAAVYQIDEAVPEGASSEEVRPFIAMEFIDGETLDARIKKGPLKIKEAVRIAMQVAGALGAAHKKDVVHRDIKSANIMLTAEGEAKVLDFGLAQTSASTKLTRMGSTLGTVAYMSPEQARGEEVDGRTDLWSLGAVLYEMVAGVNPFGGDYEQAVVYSIMNEHPEPLTAIRTGVPMELERIVNKSLSKQADLRYQSAADMTADLKALDLGASGTTVSRPAMSAAHSAPMAAVESSSSGLSKKHIGLIGLVAVVLLAIGLIAGVYMGPDPEPPKVERLVLDMEGMRVIGSLGLSPGGDFIAMTGYDWDGKSGLFLFDTRTGQRTWIERSEEAFYPWFSPSGTRLVYNDRSARSLFVLDVPAGSPTMVADSAYAGYWLDEDRLILLKGNLSEVNQLVVHDLSTGESTPVSGTLNDGRSPQYHFPGPRLPESKWSISNIQGSASVGLEPRLVLTDLDKLEARVTDIGGINPQPLTHDIIIYQLGGDDGDLVARRFDADSGEFTSPPVPFKSSVFFSQFQADPSTGSFVFALDFVQEANKVSVLDLDRGDLTTYDLAGSYGQLNEAIVSSDGGVLISTIMNGETGRTRIVTTDLSTGSTVTRASDVAEYGVDILDDGRLLSLAFRSEEYPNLQDLWLIKRNLTSQAVDTLRRIEWGGISWGGRIGNRALLGLQEEEDGPTQLGWLDLQTGSFDAIREGEGANLSPDGRFAAASGEDYLMTVLDLTTDATWELSGFRGRNPRWSPDGSAIYFNDYEGSPEGQFRESMISRIPVSTSNGFEVTGPKEFVLYMQGAKSLDVGDGVVVVAAQGIVSTEQPSQKSARIGWWRNVGHELDQTLPR